MVYTTIFYFFGEFLSKPRYMYIKGEIRRFFIMKKIIVFILTLVLLVNTFFISVSASADPITSNTGITPRWTNCATVNTNFGVANDVAECYIGYFAREEMFTYAVIKITVEKRFLLLFWNDVGEWSITSYEHSANYFANIPVDGSGKYRCHFYLEVYGITDEVDVVEHTNTYDYDG